MVNQVLVQRKMEKMSAQEKLAYKESLIDAFCNDEKPTDLHAQSACERAQRGYYLSTAGVVFGAVASIALGACDAGLGVELGTFAGCAIASGAYSSYTGYKAVKAVKTANDFNDNIARQFDVACDVIANDPEAREAELAQIR